MTSYLEVKTSLLSYIFILRKVSPIALYARMELKTCSLFRGSQNLFLIENYFKNVSSFSIC